MSEIAPIFDIRTGRQVEHQAPAEPSPDGTPAEDRELLWRMLEMHERLAETYRRKLGLIAVERGVGEDV